MSSVSQHGNELPFVFNNIQQTSRQSLDDLATDMSNSWVSFVTTLDPNAWKDKTNASTATPTWPRYVYGNGVPRKRIESY